MNVLGFSCHYHDAAACLVRDGRIVVAAEEERFTRRKHDNGFPEQAIAYCLAEGGIKGRDLDAVAFYEKPLSKLERSLVTARQALPATPDLVAADMDHAIRASLRLDQTVAETIGFNGDILYLEHHLSHAAAAFLPSPFAEAAILTVDGVGEWATTTIFHGRDADIAKLREIRYPDSLGLFYSAMTAFLGFEVNEGEYKLMGLASYGKPRHVELFERVIRLHPDGSFRLSPEFFSYTQSRDGMFTPALAELLGMAPRRPDEDATQRHMDMAASMQKVVEDALVGLARAARDATGARALCMAGGVAHNVVANTAIRRAGLFEEMFIQPASGDSGGAIGAALYADHQLSGVPRRCQPYDTCLGPAYSDDDIRAVLDAEGVSYRAVAPDELCRTVARLVAEDFVVGWFQGRMEFGPRALGSRSILANPCNAAMKDIVNARIKFREPFRPFAPAVLAERAGDYFDLPHDSPFMLYAADVHPSQRDAIPAVTHVDGTARVQTVSPERSPLFHRLLTELGTQTGVPVVLNTSFNVKGEPIVRTPADALRCFRHTDMDFLAIGNFLVIK